MIIIDIIIVDDCAVDISRSRLVDRAVESVGRLIALPPPKHQDLESAKSIVVFLIKVFIVRIIITEKG